MNKKQIQEQVLNKVTPTKEYRKNLGKIVEEIDEILGNEIKKRDLPVKTTLVGSTAKDTYLKNNMDIDFFLIFPRSFSKEKIAKNAISIGETFLENTEESYAEHPYLRGYYKDYYVEIVPCYDIKDASQKLSAVDRTPLHTKYVKENIKEEQKQEVRLFKQFLIGIGCYGAEAQIEGFSGYLCEILILKYGTFEELIKNAQNWKSGKTLTLSNKKFQSFDTPLTFIDPVDNDRNVASALSKEKFDVFIKACKEYIKNPKQTFFFPNPVKPWTISKIKNTINEQDAKYIAIKFEKPEIIDENLYPQVRKTAKAIFENLQRYDFKVYDTDFFVGENNIYIIVKTEKGQLSKTMIHKGPPEKKEENSEQFKEKWKNHKDLVKGPYTDKKRLYVEIKRQYVDVKTFLEEELEQLSLGKHIDKIVNKKYSILEENDLFSEKLKVFWTEYLDKKMPWER